MHNRIGCIRTIFLQSEFSSVSSNCLPQQMQNHIGWIYVAFPYVFFLTNCWMFHKKRRSWWWQINTVLFSPTFAIFSWWIRLLLSLQLFVSMGGRKMQHKVTQHLNFCYLSCDSNIVLILSVKGVPALDGIFFAKKLTKSRGTLPESPSFWPQKSRPQGLREAVIYVLAEFVR